MTKSRFRSFRKFIGTLTCKNWTSALHDVYDEGEGMITNRPVKKSVENTERTTPTETSFNFNSYHGASSADDDLPKQSFFRFFISSNGPPQVVFISFLLALALGSTIGVVRSNNFNYSRSFDLSKERKCYCLLHSAYVLSRQLTFPGTGCNDRQICKTSL